VFRVCLQTLIILLSEPHSKQYRLTAQESQALVSIQCKTQNVKDWCRESNHAICSNRPNIHKSIHRDGMCSKVHVLYFKQYSKTQHVFLVLLNTLRFSGV